MCLIRVGANLCRDTGPPGSTFPTPGVPDSAVGRQVCSTLSRFVVRSQNRIEFSLRIGLIENTEGLIWRGSDIIIRSIKKKLKQTYIEL